MNIYVLVAWVHDEKVSTSFVVGVFDQRTKCAPAYDAWVEGGGYGLIDPNNLFLSNRDDVHQGYEIWDRTLNEVTFEL